MDTTITNRAPAKIIGFSPPASPGGSTSVPMVNATAPVFPAATTATNTNSASATVPTYRQSSSPVSRGIPLVSTTMNSSPAAASFSPMFTPKKDLLNRGTPGGAYELQAVAFENPVVEQGMSMKLVKERYLISVQPSQMSNVGAPPSYRHLIDLTCANMKCLDVYTGEEFLCKIINEPLHKVQRAYFQLQQDSDLCQSKIYGHQLIRGVHDIVPLSSTRTYIIISPVQHTHDSSGIALGVYENLHSYIRNSKRISEDEARTIFHQICQTVQVCHQNGIILRDLKLKRFYFIDEARTMLQYESLEGSMLLDDPENDTLSDKIGCPLYTAPELLCQHPTYQGKPADMWSLGVILYTMLVGQYPFYENANCNLITMIRHSNVQIPSSLSKSVRWLLLALLRKNATERITASHIFLLPWLREQKPFYMYLPVDVEVMEDSEKFSDGDFNEAMLPDDQQRDSEEEEEAIDDDDDDDDDEVEEAEEEEEANANVVANNDRIVEQQPLDYTQTTLQMAEQLAAAALLGRGNNGNGTNIDLDVDVDVGMG